MRFSFLINHCVINKIIRFDVGSLNVCILISPTNYYNVKHSHFLTLMIFFYFFVFTYHFKLMVYTLSLMPVLYIWFFAPTLLYDFLIYTFWPHSPSSTSTNLSFLFNNETFLLREMMLLFPSPKLSLYFPY